MTAYDGNNGGDRITVTIDVTDVVENVQAAPSVEASALVPAKTALLTNFPNPFNPETWIPYHLAKPAEVTLTIYDIRGVVVRELQLGHQAAGFYQSRSQAIYWDGRNGMGEKVASGLYFYTLKAGDFIATRRLLIRK
ncbi:T9SS type A sorting domain-containing protein [Candidatus Poribacteria bacterium]|nr:T9SS type A sorting domain-containing protein [Candidatus Poribacteria bacterium]MYK16781.1 T9SS type A sorting domain-containing protein [Candidatus Poribacteria bacterium]